MLGSNIQNSKSSCCYCLALKGTQSALDRADLDASFVNFEKRLPQPEIKVRVEYI